MEEEKAAAYYDELTRNGGGAARFKHGLGFSGHGSGSSPPPPSRGSLLPSSSLFSNFVKASSPKQSSKIEKQAQLESIQNKLKKKTKEERRRPSPSPPPRHRSRSRDRDGERRSRGRRSRSRSRERYRDRDNRRRGRRSRSRSRSASPRRGRRSNRRSRNSSPRERRRSEKRRSDDAERERARNDQNGSKGVDYSTSIQGYDKMTPAEKVKARMKLQLDETAKNDTERSMGKGWERFEFNMDAPLDDEEIEAGEDDAALVKHIGKSFRYSAVEARREEQIRAAHDEAMFGAPAFPPSITLESEPEGENDEKGSTENHVATTLVSEKVLAKQQGSWRDRVRNV